MEQSKKGGMKFVGMMLIYILLSVLGVFGGIGTVLFPFLALPFTLYCMRNKVATNTHILFHIVISMVIYVVMGNVYCILIYCIAVAIPAYMMLVLYKQEISLPNVAMYIGLGLSVVVFMFFALMKYVGIDFEAQFVNILNEMTTSFTSAIDYAVQVNANAGLNTSELQQAALQMKESITVVMDTFKLFYPAIIVSQLVMSTGVLIIVLNWIGRRKDKAFPSNRELLEFRVSKVAIFLLLGCMLLSDLSIDMQDATLILVLNLMSFLMNLLQVAGTLGLIALLRKTSVSNVVKCFGYIAIIFLFIFFPYGTMFFGCLDAVFNYRKVKIVV